MNGEIATVGQQIDVMRDAVAIDGVVLPLNPDLRTWLVYKPAGVVSTMSDPQGRPTVRSLVPAEPVTNPVGRLDLHSEGLMLMTNDGDLALRVTHPRYGIEKTYHVLVRGTFSSKQLNRLTDGLELDDGIARAKRARVADAARGRTVVELTMTEGRKREIRRMFSKVGADVDRLVRTAIAGIADRTLDPGEYRPLTFAEIREIYAQSETTTNDD
ncbi:MAG: pseudouridine synthase [Acidimicrobiia bacterium]|nr:MAG: pseudouridine synthase [Acidimicrobiia bacterium]